MLLVKCEHFCRLGRPRHAGVAGLMQDRHQEIDVFSAIVDHQQSCVQDGVLLDHA
jgi:hypothetical protein